MLSFCLLLGFLLKEYFQNEILNRRDSPDFLLVINFVRVNELEFLTKTLYCTDKKKLKMKYFKICSKQWKQLIQSFFEVIILK